MSPLIVPVGGVYLGNKDVFLDLTFPAGILSYEVDEKVSCSRTHRVISG